MTSAPWLHIARRAWPQRGLLLLAAASMAVTAVTTALYAFLLGPLVQALFAGSGAANEALLPWLPTGWEASWREASWLLPGVILAVAGAKAMAWWGQRVWMARAGEAVVEQVREEALAGLLEAEFVAVGGLRVGDVAGRLTHDAELVREAVSEGMTALCRDGLTTACLLALAVGLDPQLAAVALVAFPLAAVAVRTFGRRLRGLHRRSEAERGDLGAVVGEALAGLEAIKADAQEAAWSARAMARARRLAEVRIEAAGARAANSAVMELVGVGGIALTLAWAVVRIEAGALRPDAFVSFFAALLMLYEPLKGLGRVNAWMQAGASGLERLGALTALPREPDGGAPLQGPIERLELDAVGFGYDAREPVVAGLSLRIEAGELVQLTGPSGAGKSTVVRLMLGLLSPTAGQVRVNGRPLEEVERASLRRAVAYAGQRVLLFAGTVAENIRQSRPEATMAEVREAARIAMADAFIEGLPDGYATRLGEGGQGLSGGQRQRLAVARAVLKGASALILDEALTGLEAPLQAEVLERLRAHRPEVMVVLVTHARVVEGGRVVEVHGPR